MLHPRQHQWRQRELVKASSRHQHQRKRHLLVLHLMRHHRHHFESSPLMTKLMIEKVMRHFATEKVHPIVLSKVVRHFVKALIKSSVFSHSPRRSIVNEMLPIAHFESHHESPMHMMSSRRHHLVEKVLRNPIVLSKVIRRLVKKSLVHSHEENVHPMAVFELLSTILSHRHHMSHHHMSHHHAVEHKIVKALIKKALRHRRHHHEMPVEVVLAKVIRRLVKSHVFPKHHHESSLFSMTPMTRNVEEVCHVCEKVCEPMHVFEAPIFSTKVCRVCEKVCPTMTSSPLSHFVHPTMTTPSVFGRHFDF